MKLVRHERPTQNRDGQSRDGVRNAVSLALCTRCVAQASLPEPVRNAVVAAAVALTNDKDFIQHAAIWGNFPRGFLGKLFCVERVAPPSEDEPVAGLFQL